MKSYIFSKGLPAPPTAASIRLSFDPLLQFWIFQLHFFSTKRVQNSKNWKSLIIVIPYFNQMLIYSSPQIICFLSGFPGMSNLVWICFFKLVGGQRWKKFINIGLNHHQFASTILLIWRHSENHTKTKLFRNNFTWLLVGTASVHSSTLLAAAGDPFSSSNYQTKIMSSMRGCHLEGTDKPLWQSKQQTWTTNSETILTSRSSVSLSVGRSALYIWAFCLFFLFVFLHLFSIFFVDQEERGKFCFFFFEPTSHFSSLFF